MKCFGDGSMRKPLAHHFCNSQLACKVHGFSASLGMILDIVSVLSPTVRVPECYGTRVVFCILTCRILDWSYMKAAATHSTDTEKL